MDIWMNKWVYKLNSFANSLIYAFRTISYFDGISEEV